MRLNGFHTNWFQVNSGLKQGCVLSPLLFNLFINDLTDALGELNIGIHINGQNVCVMLYVDDVVLLAQTPEDINILLGTIVLWCGNNQLSIKPTKSNVVHFRGQSVVRTNQSFKCGEVELGICEKYSYLELLFTEHLDHNEMAKTVAKSASSALGLVIAKSKALGGLPYGTFTKLYDSMV